MTLQRIAASAWVCGKLSKCAGDRVLMTLSRFPLTSVTTNFFVSLKMNLKSIPVDIISLYLTENRMCAQTFKQKYKIFIFVCFMHFWQRIREKRITFMVILMLSDVKRGKNVTLTLCKGYVWVQFWCQSLIQFASVLQNKTIWKLRTSSMWRTDFFKFGMRHRFVTGRD